jgi:hypothetical protein
LNSTNVKTVEIGTAPDALVIVNASVGIIEKAGDLAAGVHHGHNKVEGAVSGPFRDRQAGGSLVKRKKERTGDFDGVLDQQRQPGWRRRGGYREIESMAVQNGGETSGQWEDCRVARANECHVVLLIMMKVPQHAHTSYHASRA